MGRSAYWKRLPERVASPALGDASRGAFLAFVAVSTRRKPAAIDPPRGGLPSLDLA